MSAQRLALLLGIAYVGAGLLGFLPGALTQHAGDPEVSVRAFHGRLLGLFPVNVLHTLVHLAIGVWGIAAAQSPLKTTFFLKSIAIFYGALAVAGVIPGLNTMFGLLPLHGHDVWLHALTAAAAAYGGWVLSPRPQRSPPGSGTRTRDRKAAA